MVGLTASRCLMTTTTTAPDLDPDGNPYTYTALDEEYDIYPAILGSSGPNLKDRLLSDCNYPAVANVMGSLQVTLAETIPYFQDADTKTTLQWVLENINSIRALVCWGKSADRWIDRRGDDNRAMVDAIAYMEKGVAQRKLEIEPLKNSVIWDQPDLWRMEYLSEELSRVHLYCRRVFVESTHEPQRAGTKDVAMFLETLRTYLHWQMRHENRLRGGTENVGQSGMDPFPLS